MLAGFTTRDAGSPPDSYAGNLGYHVGDDPGNVDTWRAKLQAETGPLSWMSQVHGTTILDAEPHVQEADGLLLRPGQGGAVMVADCVPLLMVGTTEGTDPDLGSGSDLGSDSGATDKVTIGAVVHVGRAGLLGGIATKAAGILREEGATTIRAVIGPAICGDCYEVGEELAARSEQIIPGSSSVTRWGSRGIDIPGTLERELRILGVEVDRVLVCTMEDERFFSHRRQHGRAGRFAGVLVLAP